MAELHRRELDTASVQAAVELSLAGVSAQVDMKKLDPVVADLRDRLTHRAYGSAYIRAARERSMAEVRRLQQIEALSSDD